MADFQGYLTFYIENEGLLSLLRLPVSPRPHADAHGTARCAMPDFC
jgi:hypothetical protein